jgi:membrane-bound lytic murein transglycosylase D
MIAAALVAKDPEAYGFGDSQYQDPLCYDKVRVSEVTTLGLIAEACEASVEELKELNPELLRGCTPPGVSDYEVRIPCGRREVFVRNFEALQPLPRFQFKTHIVRKGDTLSGIARRYRVDMQPLLEINKLRKNSRLSIGMNLLIPIPLQQAHMRTVLARETSDGNGKKPQASRSPLVSKRSAQHPRRSAR